MYILDTITLDPFSPSFGADFRLAWSKYYAYLDACKDLLPQNVYEFARADWHYNAKNQDTLHDAWVENVSISEIGAAPDYSDRELHIQITLLGPYHDKFIILKYGKVRRYLFDGAVGYYDQAGVNLAGGHGDWLIDEIRLSKNGLIEHEIRFRSGSTWLIEFANFEFVFEKRS